MASKDNGGAASSFSGFSFAAPAKKKQKTGVVTAKGFSTEEVVDRKESITGMYGSEIQSVQPKKKKEELVIPLNRENNWRIKSALAKKGTVVDEPPKTDAEGDKDKVDAGPVNLTTEERAIQALQNAANGIEEGDSATMTVPLLMQNNKLLDENPEDEAEQFRSAVAKCPDESTLDDYDSTPIDAFGEAVLRGMGWKKGVAIGGVVKGLNTPVHIVGRQQRLGLSAVRDKDIMPDKRKPKKYIKPGESRVKKDMVAAPGADGKRRHTVGIDEALVEREVISIREGAFVLVTHGPHRDLCGQIKSISGDKIHVQLTLGSQIIKIHEDSLRALSKADYALLAKQKSSSSSSSKSKSQHSSSSSSSLSSSSSKDKSKRKRAEAWLSMNIRVRIVSDSYQKGRYYNKKVKIVDVKTPTTCDCVTDEGKLLEDVWQEDLETIIPKADFAIVAVVKGKLRGSRGKLVQRSKSNSTAVVQLMGEPDVKIFSYDDISEYLGEAVIEDW